MHESSGMSEPALPQSVARLLPAIRQALGGIRNVVIVDASADPPATFIAYFRSWLADGMRLLALSGRDWRDTDSWVGNDTRLLFVLAQGRPLSGPLRELINRLPIDLYRVIGVNPETGAIVPLVQQFNDYMDSRLAAARQNSLEFSGLRSRSFSRFSFPMQLRVSSRYADDFSSQFAIAAKGPDLPDGQRTWFRLEPGFAGVLSIDRDVDLGGDTWRLEAVRDGTTSAARLVQTEPFQEAQAGPLDAVAIILDRTCPDDASWERALNLTQGTGTEVGEIWRDNGGSPEEYNGDIVKGLREGFKAAFEMNLIRELQPWWCKDLPGNDVANFVRGMEIKGEEETGYTCEYLFSVAGYSPGLDLWDPLELALDKSLEQLSHGAAQRSAILLVGNSPPSHPTQDSPLRSLAFLPGASMQCTIRRQSPQWHEALARCAEARIPVIYLFLRHTRFGAVRSPAVELYEQTQNRVEAALRKTIPLASATAAADSVRDGVVNAIRTMHTLTTVASRVELEEMKVAGRENW
jgi:hypothetical protein